MGKKLSGLRLGIFATGLFICGNILVAIIFGVWWSLRKPPIPASPVTSQYDPKRAVDMLLFADSAYCGDKYVQNPIVDWDCPSCRESQLESIHLFYNESQQTFGFVGLRPNTSTIVVSFRGPVMCSKAGEIDAASDRSCGSSNFASMYDMTMEDMAFGVFGKLPIHRGYKRAYLSVKDQVNEAIHGLLNLRKCSKMDANCNVVFTGHSMGCALATLAFFDKSVDGIGTKGKRPYYPVFHNSRVETSLYGFGCPPVGDAAFLSAWQPENYDLSNRTWRIVHGTDLVNHIGNHFHLSTYAQIPREVYYPGDGQEPFTVCDGTGEDMRCSAGNSFWITSWNMRDNYRYLGHRMGCCSADNSHCAFPDLSQHYHKPYPLAAAAEMSYPYLWALNYQHKLNPMYAALLACIVFISGFTVVSAVLGLCAAMRCCPEFFGSLGRKCNSICDKARYIERKRSRRKLITPDHERSWDQF